MKEYNEYLEFVDFMNPESFHDDFTMMEASIYGVDISGTTYLDQLVDVIDEQTNGDINTILNDEKLTKICNKVIFPNSVKSGLVSGNKIKNIVESVEEDNELVWMVGNYFEQLHENSIKLEREIEEMCNEEDYDDIELNEEDIEAEEIADEDVPISSDDEDFDEDLDPDLSDIDDDDDDIEELGEGFTYFDDFTNKVVFESTISYDTEFDEDYIIESEDNVIDVDDGIEYDTEYANEEIAADLLTKEVYADEPVIDNDDGIEYDTEYDNDEDYSDDESNDTNDDDDDDEYIDYDLEPDEDIDDIYDDEDYDE